MADDRYDRTTHDGKTVDKWTKAALEACEAELGYPLSITQGSYNTSVGASAGTHAGAAAVDLRDWDWSNKVRVLRKHGFAAWRRTPSEGPWPAHIHAVLLGNERAASAAKAQMDSYRRGRNGLKGDGPDTFPWRPNPIPIFKYKAAPPPKALRVHGVDVSHWQNGNFDLDAAHKAGVRWLYHKATEGVTVTDANYDRRRREVEAFNNRGLVQRIKDAAKVKGLRNKVRAVRKRSIWFGAYHFARPDGGDAAAEARAFLKRAQVKPGDVIPWLDLEVTGGLSTSALDTWGATFIREVNKAGFPCAYYGPFKLPKTEAATAFIIRPRYNDSNIPPVLDDWDIHQFSNGELGVPNSVDGIGKVDLNHMRDDFRLRDMRIKKVKPEPEPDPEPDPEPKPPKTDATLATFNVGDSGSFDDLARLVAECRDRTRGRFVIALQEVGDRDAELARAARELRVKVVRGPKTRGQSKVALLVPERAKVVQGIVQISPGLEEFQKPGSKWKPDAKHIIYARVTFAGGAEVTVGGTHLVPYVRGDSKVVWREKLRGLHKVQRAGCIRWLNGRPGAFLLGDFNDTPGSDRMADFKREGYRIHGAPSHPARGKNPTPIDLCVTKGKVTDVEALTGYGSDHRPVVFTVDLS